MSKMLNVEVKFEIDEKEIWMLDEIKECLHDIDMEIKIENKSCEQIFQ